MTVTHNTTTWYNSNSLNIWNDGDLPSVDMTVAYHKMRLRINNLLIQQLTHTDMEWYDSDKQYRQMTWKWSIKNMIWLTDDLTSAMIVSHNNTS